MRYMGNKINIGSWASVIDANGVLWISSFHFNGLFTVDLEARIVECVTSFEGVSLGAEALHREAYLYEDEIIFLPLSDKKIRIYNRRTKVQSAIDIPKGDIETGFSRSVKVADAIYFMSDDLKIWKYQLKEKIVIELKELSAKCIEYAKDISNPIFKNTFAEGFLLMEEEGNRACKIDLRTYCVKNFIVSTERQDLRVMHFDGNRYWFFLKDSQDVLSWDGRQEWMTYKSSKDEWVGDNKAVPYYNMFFLESGIYISNYYAKNIAKINEDKRIVEVAFAYPENYKMLNVLHYGALYSQVLEYDNQVVFVPQRGNLLFIYNVVTKDVKSIEFATEKEKVSYISTLKKEKLIGNRPVRESDDFLGLSDMIEVTGEKRELRSDTNRNTIGADVYKILMA